MPTTTTTYSFNKPTVGGDEDAWGGYLNGNWDNVDNLLDGTTPVTGINITSGTASLTTLSVSGTASLTTLSVTGTASLTTLSVTDTASLDALSVTGTGAVLVSSGTTAQRPSATNGMIRYNSDDAQFEGYADGAWGAIGGGGDVQTATTTSTTETAVASYTASSSLGIEITVIATDTVDTERTITKLLVTHDGTTAVATQYGEVNTDTAMASYDVDISGGNVRLLATAASANSTNFTVNAVILA